MNTSTTAQLGSSQSSAGSASLLHQRGRHYDIIVEALSEFDSWMKDDDFNPMPVLVKIMARMRERLEMSDAPGRDAVAATPRYIVDGLPEMPDDDTDFTPYLARKIIAKYQELLRNVAQAPAVGPGVIERMVTDAWNDARREAIEECALIAEGFDAACNSPRMKLFEEAGLVIAVYKRDGEIGAAIRALALSSTVGDMQPAQDEMENYRLGLAWIKGQSTDLQAKEIAATALDSFTHSRPQGESK